MNKKKLSVVLIFLILLIGAAFFWFFFVNKKSSIKTPDGSNAPFGSGGNNLPVSANNPGNNQNQGNFGTTTVTGGPDMMLPGLYLISKDPISGITVFDNKKATQIRFADRATGHIFEKVRGISETVRLTNTTIPKVYEALWSSDGRELVMRYLKDDNETIRSFYARLSASSTPDQEISGLFLDDNVHSISTFGSKVLAVKNNNQGSSIILSNFDGSKPISVFSSPFSNWKVVYSGTNYATLYSAPSSDLMGSVYSLSLSTGEYKKVTEGLGIEGLMSPDNKKSLVSDSSFNLSIINTVTNESQPLSVRTLSEKCVWSNDSVNVYCFVPKETSSKEKYPDAWYQGSSLFDDTLWKINSNTGESASISSLSENNTSKMDAVDVSINQSNNILVFKNKQDLSGWAYVLN